MSHIVFTDYPGPIVTLLLAVMVAVLSAWSFRTPTFNRLPILRWTLGALNLVTILVLIVLTWNPSQVHRTERQEQNTLLVCFDTSESMSITDSAQSRLDQALAGFDRHFASNLKDRPRCRWYGFDEDVRSLSRADIGRQWGRHTRLETALEKMTDIVQANADGQTPGGLSPCGVIVFTDGQADDKQVQSYVKCSEGDCPVLIVACGDDRLLPDVAVKTVAVPASVRADQRYDIVTQIVAQQADSRSVEVELWVNQVLADQKSIVMARADEPQEVAFSAYALAPGVDEIEVVARPVSGERNIRNNTRTRLVQVQADAGLRVLLYSQIASFDVGRTRRSLERNLKVQLDFVYDVFIDANLPKEQVDRPSRFPKSAGQLSQYDLIVLGPCRFDQFAGEQILALYEFVTKGGGSVVFLAGREPFGLAGCDSEAIRTLLPIDFDDSAETTPLEGLTLTKEGLDQHYGQAVCEEDRNADIRVTHTPARKKPAASAVLRYRQAPLVCTQRLGRGKTAVVNSRNLYQLYREDHVDGPLFQLFSDIIADVGERPQRQSHIEVFVRRSDNGADLVFEARVTDQEYLPAQQATVLLECDGRMIRMTETWPGTYMATLPGFQGMSVFAHIRVEHRDIYLGEKTVAVELENVKGEMDDTRSDKAFLQKLCEYTGAEYVDINQLDSGLFDRFQPYHMAQQDPQLRRIWARWPVFCLLCLILVLQWFLRRAKGLV